MAPMTALSISEKITACQPRNPPMAAMNFTSPKPIASRGTTISSVTTSRCGTSSGLKLSSPTQQNRRQAHAHLAVATVGHLDGLGLEHNRIGLAVEDVFVGDLLVREFH